MVKKSRPTIAFLTHSISDAYGALLWAGVMDAAREAGANSICFPGWAINDQRGFNAGANGIYDLVNKEIVDGIVISGTLANEVGRQGLQQFCEQYRPLPMASIAIELDCIPSVLVENHGGMFKLVTHLIEVHSISRLAFISGPEGNEEAKARYQGFMDALKKNGLTPAFVTPPAEWDDIFGVDAVKTLLDEGELKPGIDMQAIVTGNDNVAYGALSELHARGIRVPEDIKLTGFDAQERSRYLNPPLTTIRQPIYEQGHQATEMVLSQIRGEKELRKIELVTKLEIRQSCGCQDDDVTQIKSDVTDRLGKIPRLAFAVSREEVLSKVEVAAQDFSRNADKQQAKRLIDAFYTELRDGAPGSFLVILSEVLGQAELTDEDISAWQKVIFILRKEVLPLIEDNQVLFHIGDLCYRARVMIGERARRAQGYRRIQAEERQATLDGINQKLVTTSDEKELMSFLAEGLPKLGISSCYVSKYENPVVPTNGCRLILAQKDGHIVTAIDENHFPSRQLAPLDLLPQGRSYNLVVEPLYFRENQIGLAVFESGPREGIVYETLRGQLSSALWASRLGEYLRSLYEASSNIKPQQEPRDILQEVVERARQAVGAKAANVVILDKDGRQRRLATSGGNISSSQHSSILIGTASMVSQVMQSNERILIEDVHERPGPATEQLLEMSIEAAGCFPLRLSDKPIGAMWIFYEKPHHFPRAEVDALRLYVNQAAIAYDNARRTKELIHLRQAAEKLAQVAEVKQVLQQIVESARDVFEADSAVIWSYDAARHVFLADELVADGVAPSVLEKFKKNTPRSDGTAIIVMQRGYLAVTNVEDVKYDYLKAPTPRLRHAIAVKSFQGIALQVEGESLGVLYVNHQQPRGFDEEDETTLKTLAYDAALALKKARLLERLRKGHDAARIIAEASVLENLHTTLSAIAKGTQDALSCDAVTLYTYDQEKDEIGFPPAMVGVKQEAEVLKYKYVARGSIIYKILGREEMYVVEDVSSDPVMKDRPFVRREEIKSSVSLSLKVGDHKVGVMFVNFRHLHHFTEEEQADIELFADQAAVAIRNAQLYEDATKTTTYLQAFYDAGTAVAGTLALKEILNRITEQAQLITGRTGGAIARFGYLALVEGNKLKMMSAFPPEYLPGLQKAADNIDFEHDKRIGITGRAVKSGETQLVDNVVDHPDYVRGDPRTASELAVPIKIGDRGIGVINVEHSDVGVFDRDDKQALEALAAQAAIAIQNAQQYEKLRQTQGLVGSRTALAWMGMASSAWWHTTGNQAQSIGEQIDLLRRDLAHTVSADKYTRIDDRLSLIQDLARQIKDKPITPPLSAEEGTVSVSVNELIRERTRRLWESEPYKSTNLKLDLVPEEKATVRASPEWLRRALDILIDNAVEAMTSATQKNIVIATRRNGSRIEIHISDTGSGIPEDVLPKLLQERIDKLKGAEGMGMGLLMAQAIVQTYSGNIEVASTGPAGTTMLISLPLEP